MHVCLCLREEGESSGREGFALDPEDSVHAASLNQKVAFVDCVLRAARLLMGSLLPGKLSSAPWVVHSVGKCRK